MASVMHFEEIAPRRSLRLYPSDCGQLTNPSSGLLLQKSIILSRGSFAASRKLDQDQEMKRS